MSKSVSTFLATLGSLAAVCVVIAGLGSGAAMSSTEVTPPAPTTTTTAATDGNPWHG